MQAGGKTPECLALGSAQVAESLFALLVGIVAYRYPVPVLKGCVNDTGGGAELLAELGRGLVGPDVMQM